MTFTSSIRDLTMNIARIETIPYKIPYITPLAFATGRIDNVENVLIRLWTTDGVMGEAEAPSRPYIYGESQQSIITAINEWLFPSIKDLRIFDKEKIAQKMAWVVGNYTAKAAIDLAIHDAMGKYLQMSCHQLFGGMSNQLTVSHMIGYDSPEKMAEQALAMRQQYGINSFKVKTGKDYRKDIKACTEIRKCLPDATLYLDANHGWRADQAISVYHAIRELDFAFFEEPSPAADRIGRHRLNKEMAIPVCGDESCISLADVSREIFDGISSMICIKMARTGITESTKILHLCEGLSVPVYVGNQGDTQIGTLNSLHFGAAFKHACEKPAELTNFLEIRDDLQADALEIKEGKMRIPTDSIGMGIHIDEHKLNYYRQDR